MKHSEAVAAVEAALVGPTTLLEVSSVDFHVQSLLSVSPCPHVLQPGSYALVRCTIAVPIE